jgi:hypothetical protein
MFFYLNCVSALGHVIDVIGIVLSTLCDGFLFQNSVICKLVFLYCIVAHLDS